MNRVKDFRMARGLRQKELAELVGVSAPTVSEWEHGKKDPSGDRLRALSKLFGVDMSIILGIQPVPRTGVQNVIPVLGSIPAGIPIEAIEDIVDFEEIPAAWLNTDKEFFALKVRGVSMLPEYRDGDVIILRKSDTAETGDDCAVMINGDDATFKRFKRLSNGIMLSALNTDCDSYFFTNKEVEELPVRIIGVVVEMRRKR